MFQTQNSLPAPHKTTKILASGERRSYYYAFKGGPRMQTSPDDPEFKNEQASLMKELFERQSIERQRKRLSENRWTEDAAHKMLMNAKGRSGKRELPCTITKKQIVQKILDQNFKCALSSLPFDVGANLEKTYSRNPFMPSLDRIDNKIGYTDENTRVILSALNYAINEWGLDTYLLIARSVTELHGSSKMHFGSIEREE